MGIKRPWGKYVCSRCGAQFDTHEEVVKHREECCGVVYLLRHFGTVIE